MNYQMLKALLDSIVLNFKCPHCRSGIQDKDIEIIGAAGATINLNIRCPICHKNTFIKSEAVPVKGSGLDNKTDLDKLKESFKNFTSGINNNTRIIDEKDIGKLRDKFKQENLNIGDLFNCD